MSETHEDIRAAYLTMVESETNKLHAEGVQLDGHAFSPLLILKGKLTDAEKNGGELLGGPDGKALHAALDALHYAPEDWCVATTLTSNELPLGNELFRTMIASLQPNTLLICDEEAAKVVRAAYSKELQTLKNSDAVSLKPGLLVEIMGMRILNLGGFADALVDQQQKQIMWSRLKQIPPLSAPY